MDGLECEEGSSFPEDESNENIINSKLTLVKRCAPPTKRKKKQQAFCQSWLTVPEFLTNFKIKLLASRWKEIGRKFRNFGKEI